MWPGERPSSFRPLVEVDEQPVEPPSQVTDQRTVLPPLKRTLQHLADVLPAPVPGPSDSVTAQAHLGPFRLASRPSHHPQVPDSARTARLSSLQLTGRPVFKSRPPRKQVPGTPGEFGAVTSICRKSRPPPALSRGDRWFFRSLDSTPRGHDPHLVRGRDDLEVEVASRPHEKAASDRDSTTGREDGKCFGPLGDLCERGG